LTRIADRLVKKLHPLRFGPPVQYVYNPLEYARRAYRQYVQRNGSAPRSILLLGMNPGPWGMAQTGVPFGTVSIVRDWLGIEEPVERPEWEHPKRPVLGFACRREEVSGLRLWGWARDTFGTPAAFFQHFFVVNYCPLAFFETDGRNRTPDHLPRREQDPLFEICDGALRETVEYFRPSHVIGLGRFAEKRARIALAGMDVVTGHVPHPSPANPAANRNWAQIVDAALAELGALSEPRP
jgi:single-strand selective monofunctional uracil DNA glycosylase